MNTNETPCRRAVSILRRQSRGLDIRDRDLEHLRVHLLDCPRCRADSAIIRGTAAESAEDELDARRTAETVLRRLSEEPIVPSRTPRRSVGYGYAAVAAAAVVVFGVGGALWLSIDNDTTTTLGAGDDALAVTPLVGGEADDAAKQDGKHPKLPLEKGAGGILSKPAARFADEIPPAPFAKGGEAQPAHTDLREGGEGQPAHPHSLDDVYQSPQGRNGETSPTAIAAALTERQVLLPTGIELLLRQNTRITVHDDATGISVDLTAGALVASVDPARRGPPFRVVTALGQVAVTGTVFSVTADGVSDRVAVLRGSVSVTRPNGTKASVSQGEGLSLAHGPVRRLDRNANDSLSSAFAKLTQNDFGEGHTIDMRTRISSAKADPAQPSAGPSVKTLLRQVRGFMSQKAWKSAESTYRDLMRRHPQSHAAKEALVALGDIYLKHLGSPNRALANYNQYLRTEQTTLMEEALVGKARALKALGRFDEEQAVLERFQSRFANSVHGPAVKRRLLELQKMKTSGGAH